MQRTAIVVLLIGMFFFMCCGDGEGGLKAKMESGSKVYLTYCQSCHMDDGAGVPGMNAPLKGSLNVAGDKEKLVRIVLLGSAFFANDPERHYQNTMPPQSILSNEQIADVLTYIRNSFTNKGSLVTPDDVTSLRNIGK